MKNHEILLASGVIAVVAGIGTALFTRAFQSDRGEAARQREAEPARAAAAQASDADGALPSGGLDASDELVALRMENTALMERLARLERRLDEALSTRTPLEPTSAPAGQPARALDPGLESSTAAEGELTPAFVASVSRALDALQAREEKEREVRRKELQAQRIEDRVTRLQQELGLDNRQASGLRTALIAQDDKREALFASMREGGGEPRDLRENFRALREETYITLQGLLTPQQFAAYRESEESEFGRRGPGDFGPPGERPFEGGFGRRPGR